MKRVCRTSSFASKTAGTMRDGSPTLLGTPYRSSSCAAVSPCCGCCLGGRPGPLGRGLMSTTVAAVVSPLVGAPWRVKKDAMCKARCRGGAPALFQTLAAVGFSVLRILQLVGIFIWILPSTRQQNVLRNQVGSTQPPVHQTTTHECTQPAVKGILQSPRECQPATQ